ncbi:MAG: magnesium chelatase, partial [Actinomycetia bacterium]|nr:magnesium chelatase [Actinomycetes bacterium]
DLYETICARFEAHTSGQRASALELALEGLYLARKIAKDSDGERTVYG